MSIMLTIALAMLICAIFIASLAMYVGFPYCQYVSMLSHAKTKHGEIKLAQYLATRAGGKRIESTHTWPAFVPAARKLYREHEKRLNNLDTD